MTNLDTGALITLLTALPNLIGLFYVGAWKMGRIELKVDTMWEFQLRRGIAEGVSKGVLKKNSPISLTEMAEEAIEPLKKELLDFFESLGRRLTDIELAIEIERHFGDKIIDTICIPLGINEGTCLVIALNTVKSSSKLYN